MTQQILVIKIVAGLLNAAQIDTLDLVHDL
jgi:hypothetical protein